MRLIDAYKTIDNLDKGIEEDFPVLYHALCAWIMNQTVVDAVPVVRCKDCKWCETHTNKPFKETWNTCSNEKVLSMTTADYVFIDNYEHFCSYGEWKDDEQNEIS